MSIINDTLKALEKKKNVKTVRSTPPGADCHQSQFYSGLNEHNNKKRRYCYIISGLAFVALVSFSLGLYHHQHHDVSSISYHDSVGVMLHESSPKGHSHPNSEIRHNLSELAATVESHDLSHFREIVQRIYMHKDWQSELNAMVASMESDHNFVLAENVIDGFRRLDPASLFLKQMLAQIYVDEGNPDEASEFLSSFHPTMDQHVAYYSLLAFAYMKSKHFSKSSTLYEQLISINSSRAPWWMGLGVSYLHEGKLKEALTAFERSQSHAPPKAPYRFFLAKRIHELQGLL